MFGFWLQVLGASQEMFGLVLEWFDLVLNRFDLVLGRFGSVLVMYGLVMEMLALVLKRLVDLKRVVLVLEKGDKLKCPGLVIILLFYLEICKIK